MKKYLLFFLVSFIINSSNAMFITEVINNTNQELALEYCNPDKNKPTVVKSISLKTGLEITFTQKNPWHIYLAKQSSTILKAIIPTLHKKFGNDTNHCYTATRFGKWHQGINLTFNPFDITDNIHPGPFAVIRQKGNLIQKAFWLEELTPNITHDQIIPGATYTLEIIQLKPNTEYGIYVLNEKKQYKIIKDTFVLFLKPNNLAKNIVSHKPLKQQSSQESKLHNKPTQPIIQINDECIVCLEEAQEIEKKYGANHLRITDCCNQFLCGECLKQTVASQIKNQNNLKCPHCRRNSLKVLLAQKASVLLEQKKNEPLHNNPVNQKIDTTPNQNNEITSGKKEKEQPLDVQPNVPFHNHQQNHSNVFISSFHRENLNISKQKIMNSYYSHYYLKPLYHAYIRFNGPITRAISDKAMRLLQKHGHHISLSRNLSNMQNHIIEIETFMNQVELQKIVDEVNYSL